jgi:hypothetical protein
VTAPEVTMSRRIALVAVCAALMLAGCGAATVGGNSSPGAVSKAQVAPAVERSTTSAAATTTVAVPRKSRPNACAHNRAAQLVKVSLHAQHLWMCERAHVVYSAAVTSGIVGEYTSTPTGDYTIQGRNRDTVLTINTGEQYDVNYWIPFDAPLFGFHDSSWQDFPYGSPKYKTQGSHGCVHMPLRAIKFLYNWADVGAKVSIRA